MNTERSPKNSTQKGHTMLDEHRSCNE